MTADWIKHVKEKGVAWCGRDIRMRGAFLNPEHARRSTENGDRLVHCKQCMTAIEKTEKGRV